MNLGAKMHHCLRACQCVGDLMIRGGKKILILRVSVPWDGQKRWVWGLYRRMMSSNCPDQLRMVCRMVVEGFCPPVSRLLYS
jgi:hypothetical protein